jgi:hypothetical protein
MVQIVGTNFGTVTGKVKLGAVPARVTQWGDTSIYFIVPGKIPPGTYAVTLINSQGKSVLKRAFTVVK